MTSGEERREVAENLRELRHTTYYREEVVENICDAISIADPVNTFREPEDVYKLLADLIDPTCHMEPEGEGFRCSACGTYHDMSGFDEFPWPRCPECGSRVKASNSMPLGGEGR